MKIAGGLRIPSAGNALPHPGSIAFKRLLEGEEGTPDNLSLVLAREGTDR